MAANIGIDAQPWQLNKTLVECNRYMLENQISCDVSFLVGAEGTARLVQAHKYILTSRSPVFFAMLLGELASRDGAPVPITDLSPEAFGLMLRFLYCEECQLTADLVLPTLYASKKYLIPTLTDRCTAFLEDNLHADNVCLIYEQCILYDERALMDKCKAFIETRTEEILSSSTFLDLTRTALQHILKFESLAVTELALFQACLAWGKRECQRNSVEDTPENQRAALGECINLVHFPAMSLKEFANEVSGTGVLTADDRCSIFQYLACDDDRRSTVDLRFPVTRRQRPKPLVLKRFSTFGKSNIYSGDCSMMRLQCDMPVLIKGFGVSGSMGYDPLAELQITIKQDRNFLCNKSVPVTDELTGDIIQVVLPEGVPLQPTIWYTVIITFHFFGDHDQGSCRRGKGGVKTVTSDGVNFDFDRPDSGSLIPEVLFCRSF